MYHKFTKLVIGFDFIEIHQAMDFAKKLNKIIPSMTIENISNFSIVTYVTESELSRSKDVIKNCFSGMELIRVGAAEEAEIVKFSRNDDLQQTAQQRAQNLF